MEDGEALLFKLGDEHARRQKMYESGVILGKNNYEKPAMKLETNLQAEADRRQTNKVKQRNGPYYEVAGGDIFSKRPSSAQTKPRIVNKTK